MVSIKNNNGDWVDNPRQIRQLFDDYFVDLFTSSGNRDWADILDCVSPKVSVTMNADLTAPISVDEIKLAAVNMGSLKAPGPDGFQGIFLSITLGDNCCGC